MQEATQSTWKMNVFFLFYFFQTCTVVANVIQFFEHFQWNGNENLKLTRWYTTIKIHRKNIWSGCGDCELHEITDDDDGSRKGGKNTQPFSCTTVNSILSLSMTHSTRFTCTTCPWSALKHIEKLETQQKIALFLFSSPWVSFIFSSVVFPYRHTFSPLILCVYAIYASLLSSLKSREHQQNYSNSNEKAFPSRSW